MSATAQPVNGAGTGVASLRLRLAVDKSALVEHFAAARPSATSATMTAVDRMGFRMRAQLAEGLKGVRVNFPVEVRSSEQARTVLVSMLREARAAEPR